jgi:hypothetical protein
LESIFWFIIKLKESGMAFSYTRNLTNKEEKILLDSILDIKAWIDEAINGKLNQSLKRLAKRRLEELKAAGRPTAPVKNEDLADDAFNDPGYKNRSEREAAGRI